MLSSDPNYPLFPSIFDFCLRLYKIWSKVCASGPVVSETFETTPQTIAFYCLLTVYSLHWMVFLEKVKIQNYPKLCSFRHIVEKSWFQFTRVSRIEFRVGSSGSSVCIGPKVQAVGQSWRWLVSSSGSPSRLVSSRFSANIFYYNIKPLMGRKL